MGFSDDVQGEGREGVPAYSEAAFASLYGETLPRVWALARRVCRDEEDARDVCQEAYAALDRYWREGRLHDDPRRFLFRVVGRRATDALRRRIRRSRLEAALNGRELAPASEIRGPLQRALARLRPEDAVLLLLQSVAGLSGGELGAVERLSPAALRSRLYRVRRRLAELYEEEGGEW